MAPGAASTGRAKPKRKRARKTRTAVVSDASSSSSSSSDSSSDDSDDGVLPNSSKAAAVAKKLDSDSNSDDQSTASDSSSSSLSSVSKQREVQEDRKREMQSPPPDIKQDFSDSSEDEIFERVTLDSECRKLQPPTPILRSEVMEAAAQRRREALQRKDEKKAAILAKQNQTAGDSATREEDFQAIWMRMMVDEFGEELDALRKKEPSLTTEGGNRMPLLIDALQAGSEVFSRGGDTASSSKGKNGNLESDEVGLMLWTNQKPS